MARYGVLAVFVAVLAGVYQLYVKPLLVTLGKGRIIESIGNEACIIVPELQACEKIVLHQQTGIIYLACSTPSSRVHWTPAVGRLNSTGASRSDFIATYDPETSRITHLKTAGFPSSRGLSLHGMDVIPSSTNSSELFVYLVNHREPLGEQPASLVGADSAIEIFKTTVGSGTLTHVRTVEDPVIITPNDLVGSPDGKSFHFTNDHGTKTGLIREFEILGLARTSVGFCHVDEGCKIAISNMHGNNGITRAKNDTFYVANCLWGGLTILEKQSDNTLVLTDSVHTDRGIDNLSIDDEGFVWAAGLSDALTLVFKHFADPSVPAPSSALRMSINTGPGAFYGEKYKVDNVFEDNGSLASGITSVVHDSRSRRLFLHGLASPHLVVCNI